MPDRRLLLFYDYVPDILERRTAHREAHLALIARRKADGDLLLAGAVGDPPTGAVLVFADGADAEAFVRDDPYAQNGLVAAWRTAPWTLV